MKSNKNEAAIGNQKNRVSQDLHSNENNSPCVFECRRALKVGTLPAKTLSNMARALEMWDIVESWDD